MDLWLTEDLFYFCALVILSSVVLCFKIKIKIKTQLSLMVLNLFSAFKMKTYSCLLLSNRLIFGVITILNLKYFWCIQYDGYPWISNVFVYNYPGLPNNRCWPWTIYLCGYWRRSLQWNKLCWLPYEVHCGSSNRRYFTHFILSCILLC
jgi:hypothetical protein